ncbi:MAG: transcription termination/antitermination protein NusA [Faecalicoccus sp.]|nr:transcription termination/antitermination protein NusA [Faecalicoccus sp.]
MKLKVQNIAEALKGVEAGRNLSTEVVEEALKEALTKAYRKQIDNDNAYIKVEIIKGVIHVYHQFLVVEEEDDEFDDMLHITLADAKKINPKVEVGDFIDEEIDYSSFGRATIQIAKSVIKQKIREAEKQVVYDEYKDNIDEMVNGVVEMVEPKFVVVNIGKTLALMKSNQQIPTEKYVEGQQILVVITEVKRETKGAQVLVSRATPVFVRRLFEREVPEIYNGIIEIKAIARDPGERCKIAVLSKNENIDAIGACIGPRGQRVQKIIDELNGEKIDIFQWSDNISDLIKNALSPSEAVAVIRNEDVKDGLIVVVPDSQLSLAIGKKGKNARLAVKLTNRKIDIKSESEMKELGIDYMAKAAEMQAEYEAKVAKELAYKQQEKIEALRASQDEIVDVEDVDFEYNDEPEIVSVDDILDHDTTSLYEKEQEDVQVEEEPVVEEVPVEEEEKPIDEMEEAARLAKELRKEKPAGKVTEYTSKFENFADASTNKPQPKPQPKKTEEKPVVAKKEEVKKPTFDHTMPIYTEEELAEIEEAEMDEMESWDYDVDYDEYDDYYDE